MKSRMKRVSEAMWHVFNCHNFAEVFRNLNNDGNEYVYENIYGMEMLRKPELKGMLEKISGECCGYTHDLAWALIGLDRCADWSKHFSGFFGEMAELAIRQIARNDAETLAAVSEIIKMIG